MGGTPACPGAVKACTTNATLLASPEVGKVGLGNRYGLGCLLDKCSLEAREEQQVGTLQTAMAK